jgi:hypothetical protein
VWHAALSEGRRVSFKHVRRVLLAAPEHAAARPLPTPAPSVAPSLSCSSRRRLPGRLVGRQAGGQAATAVSHKPPLWQCVCPPRRRSCALLIALPPPQPACDVHAACHGPCSSSLTGMSTTATSSPRHVPFVNRQRPLLRCSTRPVRAPSRCPPRTVPSTPPMRQPVSQPAMTPLLCHPLSCEARYLQVTTA